MPIIDWWYVSKYKVSKPLTEGEPYCTRCVCHIDNCQCIKFIEVEVSQEEYEALESKDKAKSFEVQAIIYRRVNALNSER